MSSEKPVLRPLDPSNPSVAFPPPEESAAHKHKNNNDNNSDAEAEPQQHLKSRTKALRQKKAAAAMELEAHRLKEGEVAEEAARVPKKKKVAKVKKAAPAPEAADAFLLNVHPAAPPEAPVRLPVPPMSDDPRAGPAQVAEEGEETAAATHTVFAARRAGGWRAEREEVEYVPKDDEEEGVVEVAPPPPPPPVLRPQPNALDRLYRLQRVFESSAPRLYSYCATHVLEWPALALAWMPDRQFEDPERDYTLQYVAVGTQTRPPYSKNRNTVRVMEVAVPVVQRNKGVMYHLFGDDDVGGGDKAMKDHDRSVLEANVDAGKLYANVRGHFEAEQTLCVDAPVLRIAAMPAETNILAVRTASGATGIYNTVQTQRVNEKGLTVPETVLRGHRLGGFGLAWNPAKLGYIATGGDDGFVNYYDVRHHLSVDLLSSTPGGGGDAQEAKASPDWGDATAQPVQRYQGHTDGVSDVCWHHAQGHLLASAAMDGDTRVWDIRDDRTAVRLEGAHQGGATAAQFHPVGDFQLATAGVGGELRLWDIRRPKRSLMDLSYHGATVNGLRWSSFSETVLASYGDDGRVVIWDLAKSTLPNSYSAGGSAPPEVAFVHMGHMGRVTDCGWSGGGRAIGNNNDWLLASADTTNGVHFYTPRQEVVEDYRAPAATAAEQCAPNSSP